MIRYFTDWFLWYYVFLAVMGLIYVQQKNKTKNLVEGQTTEFGEDYRSSWVFSILVFLPLILIAGFREWSIGNYFTDSGAYITSYNSSPSSLKEAFELWDWDSRAPGFYLFTAFIKQIFGPDYRAFFMIIAIICGLCVATTYKRYSDNIVLCAFLFFASSDFISWMTNGIRQFLAVSVLLLAFPLLQKRKYIPFLLIVFLMFTIHKSSLIVIPLYFASLGKPFNKRTISVLIAVLAAIIFVGRFTNLLDDSLQGTVYSNMVSEFEGDNGTNIVRALVYSVPAFLAVINRKKIDDTTPEIIRISINMSLFTAGLYFLSVFMSGIYMGRLPIYCSLFNYILLPWQIKKLYKEEMQKSLFLLMIVLYFAFFVYQMLQWGV